MFHSVMDCSRLLGVFCLLPLLLCGCGDPGLKLRRAAFDGDVATVEKILKAHPELINGREKVVSAPTPAPRVLFLMKPQPSPITWLKETVGVGFKGVHNEFDYWNNDGLSPLDLAVLKDRETVVKVLLTHKADPNATNASGRTPLIYAAWNKSSNNAALLLAAKAKPNTSSVFGETPLDLAAGFGNDGLVEFLLDHGAQVKVFNRSGMTPLHRAAGWNHIKSVRLLLTRMSVNTPDARGNTALHNAIENGDVDICNLLLANGAEVNVTNINGKTLFQAALKRGNTNIIQLLRQHGAKE